MTCKGIRVRVGSDILELALCPYVLRYLVGLRRDTLFCPLLLRRLACALISANRAVIVSADTSQPQRNDQPVRVGLHRAFEGVGFHLTMVSNASFGGTGAVAHLS